MEPLPFFLLTMQPIDEDDNDLVLDDMLLEMEEDGYLEQYAGFRQEALRCEIANEANLRHPCWAKIVALCVLGATLDD